MVTTGIKVTDVSTTMQVPLGFILELPAQSVGDRSARGPQKWVYVWNDEAATAFAAGDVVIRDPSATTLDYFGAIQAPATNAAVALSVLGVAQHAIPAGSYGFVLCKGIGLMRTGTANVSADVPLVSGSEAAGSVKDGTVGTDDGCFIGFNVAGAVTANDTTFLAYINCPGACT